MLIEMSRITNASTRFLCMAHAVAAAIGACFIGYDAHNAMKKLTVFCCLSVLAGLALADGMPRQAGRYTEKVVVLDLTGSQKQEIAHFRACPEKEAKQAHDAQGWITTNPCFPGVGKKDP